MMRRNIKLQARTPRLPPNTNNIHLLPVSLTILLTLLLRPLIILQLPLQPRNNILNARLPLLKRIIPTPIPPPRLLIRLQRRPRPQLRQLRLTQLVLVLVLGNGKGSGRSGLGLGTSFAAAGDPVFDARIELCAEELFECWGLRAAWVVRAWVGD
jgi:hypothetical protein